jgi:hypothetical protein
MHRLIFGLILYCNHFPFSGSRRIGITSLVQAHLVLDNSKACDPDFSSVMIYRARLYLFRPAWTIRRQLI